MSPEFVSDTIGQLFMWVLPAIFIAAILKAFFKSRSFKGKAGEFAVNARAKLALPSEFYHPFTNLTLTSADGTTQIDHVYVSRFGVFVLETKNMQGWIFGRENQSHWSQKINRTTYPFQNPLRQNYKHTKVLEELLGLSPDKIHSVVVFTGNSQFKTQMPTNVLHLRGFIRYIRSFQQTILDEAEVRAIISKIEAARLTPSRATDRLHRANLQNKSVTPIKNPSNKARSLDAANTRKKQRE